MKAVSIYCLLDTRPGRENEVRYVGKTENVQQRYAAHLSQARTSPKTPKDFWIRKLLQLGFKPKLDILAENIGETWSKEERYYIQFFKDIGANLLNLAPGGEGGRAPGYKQTPEQIEKRIKARYDNGTYTVSSETKEKLSLIWKGTIRGPHSEETKRKITLSKLNHSVSESTKEKMRQVKLGKSQLPQTIEKRIKTRKNNAEQRGYWHSEKTKQKIRKSNSKSVLQFDLNNNFIKEWESISEASKILGFWNYGITMCCTGKYKQWKNFIWKFGI